MSITPWPEILGPSPADPRPSSRQFPIPSTPALCAPLASWRALSNLQWFTSGRASMPAVLRRRQLLGFSHAAPT
eukprot:14783371-Alexandrium_andersonii.AAC.1